MKIHIPSIQNIISLFTDHCSFYIYTSAYDLGDSNILPDVNTNKWVILRDNIQVWYATNNRRRELDLRSMIKDVEPAVVYINGIFTPDSVLYPLLALKNTSIRTVIAPRGMLQEGALQVKPIKKKFYLTLFKVLRLQKGIIWHATDEQEKKDILNYSSSYNKTWVVGNAPTFTPNFLPKTHKVDLPIRLVTISLIAPKKNHLWFIQILKNSNITTPLAYDIYGPADQEYLSLLKQQIKKLPKNITVNIYSAIKPSEVQRTLQNYHYFILPTKGENFGHAIFEAFNVGTPVIISPHTPWNGLQNKQAGWDIPLEENQWQSTINHAISLNQQEYQNLQSGARKIAENYMKNVDLKSQYQTMFESASKCE